MAVTVKYGIPQVDLEIYAGDDYPFVLHWRVSDNGAPPSDLDLTGTHIAQIRVQEADAEIVAVFEIDSRDATTGTLAFKLSAEDTMFLCMAPSARIVRDPDGTMIRKFTGRWDCQWTNLQGDVRTIAKGEVTCTLDVTRAVTP